MQAAPNCTMSSKVLIDDLMDAAANNQKLVVAYHFTSFLLFHMASDCVWNSSIGVACFETALGREEGRTCGIEIERKMKERSGKEESGRKEGKQEDKAESNNNGRRK